MKGLSINKPILFPADTIIEVVGNVGSGRTTICKKIAKISNLNCHLIKTHTTNPFLSKYVKNQERWAFTTDVQFTYERAKQVHQIVRHLKESPLIIDNSFDMHLYVYSKNEYLEGEMNQDEWELLQKIQRELLRETPPITATIFLDVPIDMIMKRIEERAREHELEYSKKYLTQLQDRIAEYRKDLIALKKRKTIATYNRVAKELTFHTSPNPSIKKLFQVFKALSLP
ncbi:MAG: deoxynucleoside kinase [Candidatus Levybacteria bacterium]|nr:deoxynucleoside kinase [Candidatus Levybacteria bacterium]